MENGDGCGIMKSFDGFKLRQSQVTSVAGGDSMRWLASPTNTVLYNCHFLFFDIKIAVQYTDLNQRSRASISTSLLIFTLKSTTLFHKSTSHHHVS